MRAYKPHLLLSNYSLAIILLLFSCSAFAQDTDIAPLPGVYKNRFSGQYVNGDRYQSEDILEIVDIAPDRAYIRLHLEFDNGHKCSLWGIAERKNGTLIYRDRSGSGDRSCELSLRVSGSAISIEDRDEICRANSCGTRGGYSGTSFDIGKRRAIRYMDRLTSSWQYKAALDEYQEVKRQHP